MIQGQRLAALPRAARPAFPAVIHQILPIECAATRVKGPGCAIRAGSAPRSDLSLVHQRGSLQSVARRSDRKKTREQSAHFLVDEWSQPVQCLGIAGAPIAERAGHFVRA